MKKTVKNPYEGNIRSVIVTSIVKIHFSHKRLSWISNRENKKRLILGKNFRKFFFI